MSHGCNQDEHWYTMDTVDNPKMAYFICVLVKFIYFYFYFLGFIAFNQTGQQRVTGNRWERVGNDLGSELNLHPCIYGMCAIGNCTIRPLLPRC